MKIRFSRQDFENKLEQDRQEYIERQAYLKTPAGKKETADLNKRGAKMFKDIPMPDGLKQAAKLAKEYENNTGKRFWEFIIEGSIGTKADRDKKEQECVKVMDQMDAFATNKGWVKPKDSDQFAGYWIWRMQVREDITPVEIDMALYIDFALYMTERAHNTVQSKLGEVNTDEYIEFALLNRFKRIEDAAIGSGNFSSAVRCAAFCDKAYKDKYIMQVKNNLIHLIQFAKSRYKLDITTAIQPAQKFERDKHLTKSVGGQAPLKNSFNIL